LPAVQKGDPSKQGLKHACFSFRGRQECPKR